MEGKSICFAGQNSIWRGALDMFREMKLDMLAGQA